MKSYTPYVGIDQSYSGFAITLMRSTEDYAIARKAFPPAEHGNGVDRLYRICSWLSTTLSFGSLPIGVKHVCIEGYSYASKNGREMAGELGAITKLVIRDLFTGDAGYPTIVPPTTLKSFVCGKGSASKDQMLLQVYKKWGQEFKDNNEADSYGLAQMAMAIDLKKFNTAHEATVIAGLKPHTERPPLS